MEILWKIKSQIDFYYNSSDKMSIETLLKMQDVLAGNSYYLWELYAEAYRDYVDKYSQHRIKKSKWFLTRKARKIEDEKITDKLATEEAFEDNIELFTQELFAEANLEKLRTLLKQVNIILQAIQQRVSFLKREKDLTNN